MGIPTERLRVLPGGVDVSRFAPAPEPAGRRQSPGHPPVLGLAGHLVPVKGVEIALRMLALLSGPAAGSLLRIAGTGPEEARLRALAIDLGLEGRVEFMGEIPVDAMTDYYRSLDLYLQPSVLIRHEASGMAQSESMGRALCEAESCGVPVIASRIGGIPDVVLDGVTGKLVPPAEPRALAEAVTECVARPQTLSAMGAAGRRLALERFSWERVVDETERHLEEAVSAS
jgi:glycosyltransferase involved in cell wall biosynthesis